MKKNIAKIALVALLILPFGAALQARAATRPESDVVANSELQGTLSAQDFGVVSYDTGLGILNGYTAGFGVTDASLAGSQSVVVKLYNGHDLLQTNTAIISKFNADITGNQFSSPFDVSGNFNYALDGYWNNVKNEQYGQSVPANRVVATVVLANGKVVTVENTNPTGDPTTIFSEIPSGDNSGSDTNGNSSQGIESGNDANEGTGNEVDLGVDNSNSNENIDMNSNNSNTSVDNSVDTNSTENHNQTQNQQIHHENMNNSQENSDHSNN